MKSAVKPWYKSKTIIASIGSLVVSVATLVFAINGIEPDSMIATSVMSALMTTIAIWGRVVASEPVGIPSGDDGESG